MEIGAQWSVAGSIVGQKMSDAARCGENRADERIPTQAKADDFTADGIFLSSESESDESGTIKVGVGGSDCEYTPKTNIECDVAQAKGCILTRGSGVFAGPTKEEECNAEHVDHGQCFDRVVGASDVGGVMDHRDRDWLDPVGRWILAGVAS
jgi:hypothetical protein